MMDVLEFAIVLITGIVMGWFVPIHAISCFTEYELRFSLKKKGEE